MKQKVLSILSGEQYKPEGRAWDTYDVWADASDFYHSLDNAILRADFERVIVEFLYSGETALQDFALMMCYELKIRAAIPKLLSIIREQPEHPEINLVCMALGAMGVEEAADVFEANDYIFELFQVDFYRAIPLAQRLIERACAKGHDRHEARTALPRHKIFALENVFYDLYARFGTKGMFLLLEELEIANEHQMNFILDIVTGASYQAKGRKMIAMAKKGQQTSQERDAALEMERQAIVDEVKRWLQSRPHRF